ncbi:hypothetical protein L596_024107 [Steinernema carpocapsae]|uniref:Uncharacterized protein n=1 Tax=Steinernema carpocapsae TaxID=34508 RepID=A0A4U5MFS1_STECR|nr:hypothetical protein L596_024107 [Steinernema carpocapsae]
MSQNAEKWAQILGDLSTNDETRISRALKTFDETAFTGIDFAANSIITSVLVADKEGHFRSRLEEMRQKLSDWLLGAPNVAERVYFKAVDELQAMNKPLNPKLDASIRQFKEKLAKEKHEKVVECLKLEVQRKNDQIANLQMELSSSTEETFNYVYTDGHMSEGISPRQIVEEVKAEKQKLEDELRSVEVVNGNLEALGDSLKDENKKLKDSIRMSEYNFRMRQADEIRSLNQNHTEIVRSMSDHIQTLEALVEKQKIFLEDLKEAKRAQASRHKEKMELLEEKLNKITETQKQAEKVASAQRRNCFFFEKRLQHQANELEHYRKITENSSWEIGVSFLLGACVGVIILLFLQLTR